MTGRSIITAEGKKYSECGSWEATHCQVYGYSPADGYRHSALVLVKEVRSTARAMKVHHSKVEIPLSIVWYRIV